MKITLRKAHALQLSIMQAFNESGLNPMGVLKRYEDPAKVVADASAVYQATAAKQRELLAIYYDIRGAVATANGDTEINATLTEMALIDKLLEITKPLAKETTLRDDDAVLRAVKDLEEAAKNPASAAVVVNLGHRSGVTYSVVTKEMKEAAEKQLLTLKRRKIELTEKLLYLNTNNTVDLADDAVKALESYGVM